MKEGYEEMVQGEKPLPKNLRKIWCDDFSLPKENYGSEYGPGARMYDVEFTKDDFWSIGADKQKYCYTRSWILLVENNCNSMEGAKVWELPVYIDMTLYNYWPNEEFWMNFLYVHRFGFMCGCNFNTKLAGRTGHDLREALPEREAAGGKDTGAAGPVVRSMSWDGTALKHTVWPVHPSGWKRPADYPIKGE